MNDGADSPRCATGAGVVTSPSRDDHVAADDDDSAESGLTASNRNGLGGETDAVVAWGEDGGGRAGCIWDCKDDICIMRSCSQVRSREN